MKTNFIGLFIMMNCCYAFHAIGQSNEKVAIGFQISQLQDDFGLGLQVNAPIIKRNLLLQLSANNHWHESPGGEKTQINAYQVLRLGTMGGWMVAEKIKVYGAGGVMTVLPSQQMSSKRTYWGGYGAFGFEFFTEQASGSSLFIEMGGTSADGRADLLVHQPLLGAGFLLQSGFRIRW